MCLFLSGAWKISPNQERWNITTHTVYQWEEYFLTDVWVFTESVLVFVFVVTAKIYLCSRMININDQTGRKALSPSQIVFTEHLVGIWAFEWSPQSAVWVRLSLVAKNCFHCCNCRYDWHVHEHTSEEDVTTESQNQIKSRSKCWTCDALVESAWPPFIRLFLMEPLETRSLSCPQNHPHL